MRPTREQVFMRMAMVVADRGTCDRARVGALLVSHDNLIVWPGYNGAPRGLGHCDELGHLMVDGTCQRATHAEINAIIHAARAGGGTIGSTLYTTHFPCPTCAKAIVTAGVSKIFWVNPYRADLDEISKAILHAAMVYTEKIDVESQAVLSL